MKILSIKKSNEFQLISKKGQKFYSKSLLLLCLKTPQIYSYNHIAGKNAENFFRIGFTVSKTIGNAVVRNLAKRRLREAVRTIFLPFAKSEFDYVIIARREIKDAKYQEILSDLKFCIKRIHKANEASNPKALK